MQQAFMLLLSCLYTVPPRRLCASALPRDFMDQLGSPYTTPYGRSHKWSKKAKDPAAAAAYVSNAPENTGLHPSRLAGSDSVEKTQEKQIAGFHNRDVKCNL